MNTHPGLIGKKLGNTQFFHDDGNVARVTAVRVGPCTVVGHRTVERDGYSALIEALDDKERVFEAAWALGELKIEEAREPLFKVAQSVLKPLATKAAAAAALVRLGDRRGVPLLRSVLRAFRSDARSYAVELVGELGLSVLADDVAALAIRPRGADPVVVAKALGKLAAESPRAREALSAMAKRDDEAGQAAREVLEQRA